MAKLYFNYGPMNSGKSQMLINTVFNYRNQQHDGIPKKCLVYTTSLDTRSGKNMIESRSGASVEAKYVTNDIFEIVKAEQQNAIKDKIYAMVVDEAQFLTIEQVMQITDIVDVLDIPVICYGLKTDYTGHMFAGSQALFEYADKCTEIKTICFECSINKAIMNVRLDENNQPALFGTTIMPGSNYIPVCRKCYKKLIPEWNKRRF